MGESVKERCLIKGNPSNLPRASGPILPQTKNVEQFGGRPQQSTRQSGDDHRGLSPKSRRPRENHQGPSPSSRQNTHSRQPWQGSKWPRWLPSSRQNSHSRQPWQGSKWPRWFSRPVPIWEDSETIAGGVRTRPQRCGRACTRLPNRHTAKKSGPRT